MNLVDMVIKVKKVNQIPVRLLITEALKEIKVSMDIPAKKV